MKRILGILTIIASIVLGLYIGVWLMFAGGIIQIVNSINPLNGTGIAIGICRVVFCELAALIPMGGITVGGMLLI